MAYCADQWGNRPIGGSVNIPPASCSDPTNLAVTVNGTKALLSWVAPHDFLRCEVLYWKTGDAVPTTPLVVYGQSVWVEPLDPSITYHWRVRLVCEDSPLRTSAYVNGPDFTTTVAAPVCPVVPSSSLVFSPLYTGMKVSWANTTGFNVVNYDLIYQVKGNTLTAVIVRGIAVNTYTIPRSNLQVNVTYEVKVIRYCNGVPVDPGTWAEFSSQSLPCIPGVTGLGLVGAAGSNSALFTWNLITNDTIVGYQVKLDGALVANQVTTLPFPLTGLTPDTAYVLEVIPVKLYIIPAKPVGISSICFGEVASLNFTTSKNACNVPLNVVTSKVDVTEGLNTIGYYAKIDWQAAAGATGYRIYQNSALVQTVLPGVLTYNTQPLGMSTSGQILLEVSTICDGVESAKVGGIVVFPVACLGPHGLSLTATNNSITVNWIKGNANAVAVTVKQGATIISDKASFGSSMLITGLLPNTTYDVTIGGDCPGIGTGLTSQATITTGVTPTCEIPIIDSIVYQEPKKATISWHLASGVTGGIFFIHINDVFVDNVSNQFTYIADLSAFAPGATVNFKVGYKGTQCVMGFASQDLVMPTACPAYSGYTFTWIDDTTLQVAAPGTPYSSHYIYYTQNGNNYPIVNYGDVLPKTVTPFSKGFYEFTAIGKCGALEAAPVKVYPPCYDITNFSATAGNGSIGGQWNPVQGAWGYEVEIVGVTTGTTTFRIQTNYFTRGGFATEELTFSVRVRPICYWVGTVEIVGNWTAAQFVTMTVGGGTPPSDCSYPMFTSFYEATQLSDGGDAGPIADNSDPATLNFKTIQGDSFDRSLTFKDSALVVIDITGYTFDMWVINPLLPMSPVLVFSSGDGSIINGGATGKIQLLKTEAQMNVVPVGVYRYSLEWTTTASIVKTLLVGDFIVLEQITQA